MSVIFRHAHQSNAKTLAPPKVVNDHVSRRFVKIPQRTIPFWWKTHCISTFTATRRKLTEIQYPYTFSIPFLSSWFSLLLKDNRSGKIYVICSLRFHCTRIQGKTSNTKTSSRGYDIKLSLGSSLFRGEISQDYVLYLPGFQCANWFW